jgi:hypothetical protein
MTARPHLIDENCREYILTAWHELGEGLGERIASCTIIVTLEA